MAGKLLTSHTAIVSSIAASTTATGLRVRAAFDINPYPAGLKVSRAAVDQVQVRPARFHGEWNYTVLPRDGRRLNH